MCGRIANRPDFASACSGVAALVRLCLAALLASMLPAAAYAQSFQYTNSVDGAFDENTAPCATPLQRTFNVTQSFTVQDVNIGILLTHTWRGDIEMRLRSPAGTVVTLFNSTGGNRDNLNVLLDDAIGTSVDTHTNNDTATAATAVPPYQRNFAPNTALSAFNGQNSVGTWTLSICDNAGSDAGTFYQADLFLTGPYADLSLTKTVSNSAPAAGTNITYTLSVLNASSPSISAASVSVLDILPAGVTFVSASGTGTYNSTTGVWTVGSVPAGSTRSITITVTVNATAGATITNSAEISASSESDVDSTPNNASTSEDDDDSVSFTVSGARVAGTPPTLSCPNGTTVHDWDSVSWTAGSTTNSYSVSNLGTVGFNITRTGGAWLANATYGGQSPARQNAVTGGFSPAQFSIFELINFTNQSETATTTITLPTAVPGAQFRIFDIDYSAGQFADRITVTGSYNGNSVTPVLTNGVSNYVIGNSAFGDATSADTSANGNLVITFTSPVDTISITYGNHLLAPADPGQQAVAIHDITFCRPVANLTVSKISSVLSDGVSTTNPKAIPGATVRYCITLSNAGSGTATSVSASDTLPATVTFVPGSMASGTSCGSASTVEDDNGIGADETDPFGMVFNSGTITGTAATMAPGSTFAMVFNVTVN